MQRFAAPQWSPTTPEGAIRLTPGRAYEAAGGRWRPLTKSVLLPEVTEQLEQKRYAYLVQEERPGYVVVTWTALDHIAAFNVIAGFATTPNTGWPHS